MPRSPFGRSQDAASRHVHLGEVGVDEAAQLAHGFLLVSGAMTRSRSPRRPRALHHLAQLAGPPVGRGSRRGRSGSSPPGAGGTAAAATSRRAPAGPRRRCGRRCLMLTAVGSGVGKRGAAGVTTTGAWRRACRVSSRVAPGRSDPARPTAPAPRARRAARGRRRPCDHHPLVAPSPGRPRRRCARSPDGPAGAALSSGCGAGLSPGSRILGHS